MNFSKPKNAGFDLFMLRFPCLLKRINLYVHNIHVDIEMEVSAHKLSTKMIARFTGDQGIEPCSALPIKTTG